jgi:hypothetical protein
LDCFAALVMTPSAAAKHSTGFGFILLVAFAYSSKSSSMVFALGKTISE